MKENTPAEVSHEGTLFEPQRSSRSQEENICQLVNNEDSCVLDEYFKEMEKIWEAKEDTRAKDTFLNENSNNNSFSELEQKIWDSKAGKRDSSPDFNKKFEKLSEESQKRIDFKCNFRGRDLTQSLYDDQQGSSKSMKVDSSINFGKSYNLNSFKVNRIFLFD